MNLQLHALHDYVKSVLLTANLAPIDADTLTWKFTKYMYYPYREYITKKREHELLHEAQRLLAPFADDERCRRMSCKWSALCYCPPTPYGQYIWSYTALMVQEILWRFPEFLAGIEAGETRIDQGRGANPYPDVSRHQSWDCGFILGLDSQAVNHWMEEKTHGGQ